MDPAIKAWAWAVLSLGVGSSMATAATSARPTLIVVIVVDQFSAELYHRYNDSFTDGLKRVGSGIVFPAGYQSHAATETCPGHSTILTGDHPSRTGIIANNWFDRKTKSEVYCVAVPGVVDAGARGPQNLRVSTLGDWLKKARPGGQIVSVSGKDRAAIMLGGHHPDAVAWWADGTGFVTSNYAGASDLTLPAVLRTWNAALRARWEGAPPAVWPSAIPERCRALQRPHRFGEITLSGSAPPDQALNLTNQKGFFDSGEFKKQLRSSPLLDAATLGLAANLAAQHKLGHHLGPDILAVSLSATDYVGHRFGNGGAEMCVQLAALDKELGTFLERIDDFKVPYVVVLTADHGAVDAAERVSEQGVKVERLDPVKFLGDLNQHLKTVLGVSYEPIVSNDPQQLYLSARGGKRMHDTARRETLRWLRQQPIVATVLTRDQIALAAPARSTPPNKLTIAERFHESYDPQRSADIMVEFRASTSIGIPRKTGDTIAGHGSPWDYDRKVPILFWWQGVSSREIREPVETVDIAPTLAAMLGMRTPAMDGRCLTAVTSCSLRHR